MTPMPEAPNRSEFAAGQGFLTSPQFWAVFAVSFSDAIWKKASPTVLETRLSALRPSGFELPIAKKDSKWHAPPAVFYKHPSAVHRCNWLDWATIYTVVGRNFSPVGFRLCTLQHPYQPLVDGVPS